MAKLAARAMCFAGIVGVMMVTPTSWFEMLGRVAVGAVALLACEMAMTISK